MRTRPPAPGSHGLDPTTRIPRPDLAPGSHVLDPTARFPRPGSHGSDPTAQVPCSDPACSWDLRAEQRAQSSSGWERAGAHGDRLSEAVGWRLDAAGAEKLAAVRAAEERGRVVIERAYGTSMWRAASGSHSGLDRATRPSTVPPSVGVPQSLAADSRAQSSGSRSARSHATGSRALRSHAVSSDGSRSARSHHDPPSVGTGYVSIPIAAFQGQAAGRTLERGGVGVAGGASAGTGVFAIDASSCGAAQLTLASLPTSSAQLVGRGGVVLEDVLSERRPPAIAYGREREIERLSVRRMSR